jgi:hypothetical protein
MNRLWILFVVIGALLSIAKDGTAQNWTQTSAPTSKWAGIASSQDGTKLAAIVENGPIYTSGDAGATWQTNGVPVLFWTGIASSSDGSRLAACAWSDGIYLSTNSGMSWQQASNTSSGVWQSIACSSDGSVIVAVSLAYEWGGILTTGPLFISTNYGATWATPNLPNRVWTTVACSSNGMVMVAATGDATIYVTTNRGLAWTTADTPAESWSSVVISADGTRQVAVSIGSGGSGGQSVLAGDGAIFVSTNSGASWIQTSAPNDYWESVACSTDGSILIAAAEEFTPATTLWISLDSGTTWTSNQLADARVTVASSGCGAKLFAVFSTGEIYNWNWQPTLSMDIPSSQQIVLSWKSPVSGAILQHNSDLNSTNWKDLGVAPTVTNGTSQIALPLGGGSQFYRLRVP